MKTLRVIVVGVLISMMAQAGFAQDTPPSQPRKDSPVKVKKTFWDKVSLGGYLGAQFGSYTYVEVSPLAIYEIMPQLYAGLGVTYIYARSNGSPYNYTSSNYGGNILVRYHVWKDLFAQVEYDPMYITYYDVYDPFGIYVGWHQEKTWVHDLLLGAGYRQWLGGRAFATLAIFWNVNESVYSPYRNPIFRIGFGIGL